MGVRVGPRPDQGEDARPEAVGATKVVISLAEEAVREENPHAGRRAHLRGRSDAH